jgi:N-acetylated-alpha-linked acidic dipeptidase
MTQSLLRQALLGATLAVSTLSPIASASAQQLPGYTKSNADRQRSFEAELLKKMAPDKAKAISREFASEPHMAGTPGQARTRDLFAKYLESYGIKPEIQTYSVYMPIPTEVRLFRVSPDPKELPMIEGGISEDTVSMKFPEQILAFNGYGADGDVTGELVYVNYGLIEDYKTLDSLGISVKGKIAIARYGRSYRGIKAREAEKNGAIGLIIYSDPAEDGYARGEVYPKGRMRPPHGVQRGSVFNGNGDPTTPDYPSLPGAKRIPLEEAELPRIPVIPISYQNAQELLAGIRGHAELPDGWQGALSFPYHIGPGPVQARIVVKTDAKTKPYKDIWNVMGAIPGSEYPEEIVIIGGHRDSWGPGAADNVSGTVSVLESARAIAELVKQGYRPKRTIVFASWDAEEWGLIGSVEYVEQDTARLSKYGVAYLNQDMVAFGPSFNAGGSPSLRPLIRDVVKGVPSPTGRGSVYEEWRRAAKLTADSLEPSMGDPGGGSDFAPFYNHLGIPIADWGFNGPQGIYHSFYDSPHWMNKFGDSSYVYHATTAVIGAIALLRIANADILPYDYVEYAQAMRKLAKEAVEKITEKSWGLSGEELLAAIDRMEGAARNFNATRDASLQRKLDPKTLQNVNTLLLKVERSFVRPEGLYKRSWFRNVIYAADDDNGYDNISLPTINEAVRANDKQRTEKELADLVQRFNTATAILTEAAQSLR